MFRLPAGHRRRPNTCSVLCWQVFRFMHWLTEKCEYKCTLKGGASSGFDVQSVVVAPPAPGEHRGVCVWGGGGGGVGLDSQGCHQQLRCG
jgi:hypothetical protein